LIAVLPALLLALLPAACSAIRRPPPDPAGSCTLGLQPGTPAQDAIRAVIQAEGDLVVKQEIDALMALWAEGATITDAKNTPDGGDDQFWLDRDAIRHRYVRTVFPGAPASVSPANLLITVEGDRAVVTATTQIGGGSGAETAAGGDRWALVEQGDCWAIENLTYNLEQAGQ
jgi:hypothetical protein